MQSLDPLMVIHVISAGIGLLAGATAIAVRKGSAWHRRVGISFVVTMLVTAVTAGYLSAVAGRFFDVMSALVAGYMVLTALFAYRPPQKLVSLGLMLIGAICVVVYLGVEWQTATAGVRHTDAPVGVGYFFATVMLLALLGDVRNLRVTLVRKQRMLRHLWRMNFGLFIATGSFFGARPHLFPEWMQTSGVLLFLTVLPILFIAYWAIWLRFKFSKVSA